MGGGDVAGGRRGGRRRGAHGESEHGHIRVEPHVVAARDATAGLMLREREQIAPSVSVRRGGGERGKGGGGQEVWRGWRRARGGAYHALKLCTPRREHRARLARSRRLRAHAAGERWRESTSQREALGDREAAALANASWARGGRRGGRAGGGRVAPRALSRTSSGSAGETRQSTLHCAS